MEENKVYRLSRRKKARIWLARYCRHWPVLVLLGLSGFVLWGVRATSSVESVAGLVEYPRFNVGVMETGRVDAIVTAVGDYVEEGDILVELSCVELDYQLAELRADEERDLRDTNRQFFNALLDIQADLRELTLKKSLHEAESSALLAENARLERLLERGLVNTDLVASNRVRLAVLEAEGAQYPSMVEELEAEKRSLLEMKESILDERARNRSELMSLLEDRKENLTIRARRSGVVARIANLSGDVVREGDTIVELVGRVGAVVRGFAPLGSQLSVSAGDRVYVEESASDQPVLDGRIRSVEPSIIELPDRSNPIMSRSVSGRMFVVEVGPVDSWGEGERIVIHFSEPKEREVNRWLGDVISWIRFGGGES